MKFVSTQTIYPDCGPSYESYKFFEYSSLEDLYRDYQIFQKNLQQILLEEKILLNRWNEWNQIFQNKKNKIRVLGDRISSAEKQKQEMDSAKDWARGEKFTLAYTGLTKSIEQYRMDLIEAKNIQLPPEPPKNSGKNLEFKFYDIIGTTIIPLDDFFEQKKIK